MKTMMMERCVFSPRFCLQTIASAVCRDFIITVCEQHIFAHFAE